MKSKILLILLLIGLILSTFACARDGHITAEKLGINDIQKYLASMYPPPWEIKVYGIHQNGNEAKVYFHIKNPKGADKDAYLDLIRFNSGKWFNISKISKYKSVNEFVLD